MKIRDFNSKWPFLKKFSGLIGRPMDAIFIPHYSLYIIVVLDLFRFLNFALIFFLRPRKVFFIVLDRKMDDINFTKFLQG